MRSGARGTEGPFPLRRVPEGGRGCSNRPSAPAVPGISGCCARWQSPTAWKQRGKLTRRSEKGRKKPQTSIPDRALPLGSSETSFCPAAPGCHVPGARGAGAAPEPGQRRAGSAEQSDGREAGLLPVPSKGQITRTWAGPLRRFKPSFLFAVYALGESQTAYPDRRWKSFMWSKFLQASADSLVRAAGKQVQLFAE